MESTGKDFNIAVIKMLQPSFTNCLETNSKIKYLSKEIEFIKEPRGNSKIEKYSNRNKGITH